MRAVLCSICIAVCLIMISASSQATIHYVNTSGSIKDACDSASAGDTISIADGIYSGEEHSGIYLNKRLFITGETPLVIPYNYFESEVDTVARIEGDARWLHIAPGAEGTIIKHLSIEAMSLAPDPKAPSGPVRGHAIYSEVSNITVDSCYFGVNGYYDWVATEGGAIFITRNYSDSTNPAQISNCYFWANVQAVCIDSAATAVIDACIFHINTATSLLGNSITVQDTAVGETQILNSLFLWDVAYIGQSAVYVDRQGGTVLVRGCTFDYTMGIYGTASSQIDVDRCIVSRSNGYFSDGIDGASIDVTCCDIFETLYSVGSVDSNTVFEDPLFCDVAEDEYDQVWDYHISSYSPCDEDSSFCGYLIGAFDDDCDWCCNKAGDANNDGSVNGLDELLLINYLFKSGPPPPCMDEGDADGSGTTVNGMDLLYLVNYLHKGGPAPICP